MVGGHFECRECLEICHACEVVLRARGTPCNFSREGESFCLRFRTADTVLANFKKHIVDLKTEPMYKNLYPGLRGNDLEVR